MVTTLTVFRIIKRRKAIGKETSEKPISHTQVLSSRSLIKSNSQKIKKEIGFLNHVKQVTLKYKKRCLSLFIIWEMQIKITVTYHFSPIRLAKIQKLTTHHTGKAVEKLSFITGSKTKCYNDH